MKTLLLELFYVLQLFYLFFIISQYSNWSRYISSQKIFVLYSWLFVQQMITKWIAKIIEYIKTIRVVFFSCCKDKIRLFLLFPSALSYITSGHTKSLIMSLFRQYTKQHIIFGTYLRKLQSSRYVKKNNEKMI